MLTLNFTWKNLATIALEAKKKFNVQSLQDIIPLMYVDVEIFELFIREGAGLETISAARDLITSTMASGVDFEDVQLMVIDALIAANFYRAKLEEIKKTLLAEKTPVKSED